MVNHPVSSLVSISLEANSTNWLQSHGFHFILVARIFGDRTGDVRVHACLTVLVDIDDIRSENPFNYDLNDLDLDGFCLTLQRDLHEITAVRLLTGRKMGLLILTLSRSILALSSPTIIFSRPGINHLPLLTGDLRKRL